MLKSAIVTIVDFCARHPWRVFIAGLLLAVVAAGYDVARFSITTDTEDLIAKDLPWRQRQADFTKAFPEKGILVVVTASTPEGAEQATGALEKQLVNRPDMFR
jgi:predicted RND superfamily exporter protein